MKSEHSCKRDISTFLRHSQYSYALEARYIDSPQALASNNDMAQASNGNIARQAPRFQEWIWWRMRASCALWSPAPSKSITICLVQIRIAVFPFSPSCLRLPVAVRLLSEGTHIQNTDHISIAMLKLIFSKLVSTLATC
jgi:hypothetical protein